MDLDALGLTGQTLALHIADDKMSAILTIPPGYQPTEFEIEELLRSKGVVEGVDFDGITAIAQAPRAGEHVVARGTPPEPSDDADVILQFDPNHAPTPRIDDDGRANYFDLGGIPTCEAGEILGRKKAPRQGAPGRDIFGGDIEARAPVDMPLSAGANTKLIVDEAGEALIAAKAGQPVKRGTMILVRDLYVVNGDLDVSVGNIDHNGAVLIQGKVHEQLSLRAKGDMTIEGNVNSATVVCGGDLIVRGGILRKSKVVVSGTLRTRFIESSEVQVEQHLFVQEDVLFSEVEVGGNLEVQSGIVGGKCQVAGYLRASYLGKRMGTPTFVEVGSLAKWNERLRTAETRLAEAQELLGQAMQPLQELLVLDSQETLDERGQKSKERLERSVERARNQIAERLKASLRLKSLIQSLPVPKVLTPGGVIHPGVQVIIRAAMWKAETSTRASTLSEHKGVIEIF
ncbi:MAG: DUF342 domain-containing protein [Candidatus Sericytochromatia bacterium]|uniref:DUF342 domain-containing protein n=1 Tax=Candidatus Tanganyikabacteria bacterium TaxID=2961651 RepID=A0A937X5J4_9BACT|nr:DUF342 domain-containing protein [Candidatus Tanganyikabacteria bacterium]